MTTAPVAVCARYQPDHTTEFTNPGPAVNALDIDTCLFQYHPVKICAHDSCAGHGGDLVCCDHCPKVFHYQCAEPPIRLETLKPYEEWLCKECAAKHKVN
jgi:hypothetical protein